MSGRYTEPPLRSHPDIGPPLDVEAAIARGTASLAPRAGAEARDEALYLLSGLLDLSPGQLVLEGDRVLGPEEREEYLARLARRVHGEPLQYIERRATFRELQLQVNPSVLIPRPETEQLVSFVLDWTAGKEGLRALDLGTGSGAIAVSLALEGPFENVVAVDISPEALNVARENAAAAAVADRVDFRCGSLFGALVEGQRFDVIVSNPPYVASGEAASLPEEVRVWEPPAALYAGPTGFEVIAEIVDGSPDYLEPHGLLAIEVAPNLANAAAERVRARAAYGEPRVVRDLAGRLRALLVQRLGDPVETARQRQS